MRLIDHTTQPFLSPFFVRLLQFVVALKAPRESGGEEDAATGSSSASQIESPVHCLNHVFVALDELTAIIPELLEKWQPPRLVAMGNQSEGRLS